MFGPGRITLPGSLLMDEIEGVGPRSRAGAVRRIGLGALLGASLLLAWGSQRALEDAGREEPLFVLMPYRPPLITLPGPREEIAHLNDQQARGRGGYRFWVELAAAQVALAEETGDSGHFRQAEVSARKAVALQPGEHVEAGLVLTRISEARHEFARVLQETQEVLAKQPREKGALAIRARALLATGRLEEARASAERLVAEQRDAASRNLLARVLVQQGHDLEGIRLLRRGIALERTGEALTAAWARAHLADVYERRGAGLAAEGLLREAVRIAPAAPELMRRLGRRLAAAGALEEARVTLVTAWTRGRDALTLLDLAAVRRREGHPASARALLARAESGLRAALATEPTAHARDLARVLLERGDPAALSEARALLDRELTIRRDAGTLELESRLPPESEPGSLPGARPRQK